LNKKKNILTMEHPTPHDGITHFELGVWGDVLIINQGKLRQVERTNGIVVPYYSEVLSLKEHPELDGLFDGEEWDLVMVYDLMGLRVPAIDDQDTEEIEIEVVIAARLAALKNEAVR